MNIWKILSERLQAILQRIVFEEILTDEMRDNVIEKLITRIELPFVNDKTKTDLFTLIWDTVVEALAEVLGVDIDDPEFEDAVASLDKRVRDNHSSGKKENFSA